MIDVKKNHSTRHAPYMNDFLLHYINNFKHNTCRPLIVDRTGFLRILRLGT